MSESFGNLSADEALDLLGIPPSVAAPLVADLGLLSYGGNAMKVLRVNATADGWEFAASSGFEPTIAAGTTAQYWRGDKSWQTLDKAAVGLGSADNTADAAKNVLGATKLTTPRTIAITGDLAWTSPSFDGTGNVTAAGTLATVNSNTGTFGGAATVAQVSVNGKGLITGVSAVPIAIPFSQLTSVPTTLSGHNITLTSGNVTGALGYAPLNPANNLSDLASAPTARTNLGLDGNIAVAGAQSTATFSIGASGTTSVAKAIWHRNSGGGPNEIWAVASGNFEYRPQVGHAFMNAAGTLFGTLDGTGFDVVGLMRCDSFRIDQVPTAGTFTATHYLTISANGTTYRIPCAI